MNDPLLDQSAFMKNNVLVTLNRDWVLLYRLLGEPGWNDGWMRWFPFEKDDFELRSYKSEIKLPNSDKWGDKKHLNINMPSRMVIRDSGVPNLIKVVYECPFVTSVCFYEEQSFGNSESWLSFALPLAVRAGLKWSMDVLIPFWKRWS